MPALPALQVPPFRQATKVTKATKYMSKLQIYILGISIFTYIIHQFYIYIYFSDSCSRYIDNWTLDKSTLSMILTRRSLVSGHRNSEAWHAPSILSISFVTMSVTFWLTCRGRARGAKLVTPWFRCGRYM